MKFLENLLSPTAMLARLVFSQRTAIPWKIMVAYFLSSVLWWASSEVIWSNYGEVDISIGAAWFCVNGVDDDNCVGVDRVIEQER